MKLRIKNFSSGITLVEIVIVVFLIVVFSTMLIANFPKIQEHLNLSRASYKLAQDLRRAQDLGLSGVGISVGGATTKVYGYGIYVNLSGNNKEYKLYADTCLDPEGVPYFKYIPSGLYASCMGGDYVDSVNDINIAKENPGVHIKEFNCVDTAYPNATSVDFSPPTPIINIENLSSGCTAVEVVLALDSDSNTTRTVSVNKSGLIEVK